MPTLDIVPEPGEQFHILLRMVATTHGGSGGYQNYTPFKLKGQNALSHRWDSHFQSRSRLLGVAYLMRHPFAELQQQTCYNFPRT